MTPNVTLVLHGISRLSEAEYIDFVQKFSRIGKKGERVTYPTKEEVREAIGRMSGGTHPSGCPACHHINREAAAEYEELKQTRIQPRPSQDMRPDPESSMAAVLRTMAANQRRPR